MSYRDGIVENNAWSFDFDVARRRLEDSGLLGSVNKILLRDSEPASSFSQVNTHLQRKQYRRSKYNPWEGVWKLQWEQGVYCPEFSDCHISMPIRETSRNGVDFLNIDRASVRFINFTWGIQSSIYLILRGRQVEYVSWIPSVYFALWCGRLVCWASYNI